MHTHRAIAVGLAFFLLSTIARAQDSSPDSQRDVARQSEIDEAKANIARMKTRPVFRNAPDPEFPDSERALGHHGVVQISGILGADGRLHYAKVEMGSGAPVLDQSALKVYEASEWTAAKDADGTTMPVPITVPLEFFSFVGARARL